MRGTLERLLVAPVSFAQVVLGYVMGFFGFGSIQAGIVVTYFLQLTSFEVTAPQLVSLVVVTILCVLIALLLGLLLSFLAANEFQALQFIPLVVLPQVFLSDIIWDIETFPEAFRIVSYALPLTHANIAVRDALIRARPLNDSGSELLALCAFAAVLFAALAWVGRRQRGRT